MEKHLLQRIIPQNTICSSEMAFTYLSRIIPQYTYCFNKILFIYLLLTTIIPQYTKSSSGITFTWYLPRILPQYTNYPNGITFTSYLPRIIPQYTNVLFTSLTMNKVYMVPNVHGNQQSHTEDSIFELMQGVDCKSTFFPVYIRW